ncbi:ABC superfamily ATP binding cassette transporter [Psychrobacter sp. 1501(2011)]|nr:hypothetical protein [Psychrobacter sanguinis]EGK12519.1 ABC superfamily ATP binding cassette transporter [Psychrobacter sp. 1501(2011)]
MKTKQRNLRPLRFAVSQVVTELGHKGKHLNSEQALWHKVKQVA